MTTDPVAMTSEDRFAILDLLARYSWAIDLKDADAVAALFTHDGELNTASGGIRKGRDEIAALQSLLESLPVLQHFVSNFVIRGDTERATVYSCLIGPKEHDSWAVGYYVDELVKVHGAWLINRRRHRRWTEDRPPKDLLDRDLDSLS
jgi:uncharacterized protein (TIGR02246 family)